MRKKISAVRESLAPRYRSFLSWYLALLIVTCAFRVGTAYTIGIEESVWRAVLPALLRGWCSDAISVAGLLALAFLFPSLLRYFLVLVWCFLLAGNHNHIVVNGANLNAKFLQEATQKEFISGSVITPFLACATAASFAGFFLLMRLFKRYLRLPRHSIASLLGMAMAVVLFLPSSGQDWIIYNPVENNLREKFGWYPNLQPLPLSQETYRQYYKPDLSGGKFVAPPPIPHPNVLMIVIESLSARMMDDGWTPHLKEWTKQGIYYRNFIMPSRRTSNGIYSLECGDYSMFLYRKKGQNNFASSTKSAAIIKDKKPLFCLPRLLSQQNYHTLFMQPSKLSYDSKDLMNKQMGFQEEFGYADYSHEDVRSNGQWGADDLAFFDLVKDKIYKLQKEDRPYFISALTVGTHDPYTRPANFMPKEWAKKASFLYMDEALDRFLHDLKESGVLDNTLVLVTGDESAAYINPYNNTPDAILPENHGFMLALTPTKNQQTVSDIFTAPDVFMSVADYLGVDTARIPNGRSLFRHYDSFRPVFMGSIYNSHVSGMLESKKIISCIGLAEESCKSYAMDSNDLFYTKFHRQEADLTSSALFLSLITGLQTAIGPETDLETKKLTNNQ